MWTDARTVESNSTLEADICIVGGGAAGIALALEFAGQPFRVCLLESGGFDFDQETQSLYRGANAGLPYFPLDSARLRYFGGTTNHWGGICWPFEEMDFEPREWIPYSGWPFPKSAIEPFYKRALSVCQLSAWEWDPKFWTQRDAPLLRFASERVNTILNQQVDWKLRRFGRTYRSKIAQAPNITACLHANATELETDGAGRQVSRLHVACLSGNKFSVTAKTFILATGGIENARLLLLSNKRRAAGIGNQNGLVGRFFLEHPTFLGGIFLPSNPLIPLRFYREHKVKDTRVTAVLCLSPQVRRREKLAAVSVALDAVYDELYTKASESEASKSLLYLLREAGQLNIPDEFGRHLMNVLRDIDDVVVAAYGKARYRGNYPIDHVRLMATVDPAPNPESRVTLGSERDALGQRRVRLDWRLSPIDKRSARRTLEILGMELGRAGLGRLQMKIDDDDATWPADLTGVFHHMGTTRMNNDPKQGVVDKDCRVHGMSNLFIAGSSVFPTAGSGTPTLLIVALALRLADRIKRMMK